MQVFENNRLNEKYYLEKLDNGLNVIIFPKKGLLKKYITWGVNYGSIDSHFKIDGEEIIVPDGIAHYLEHKLFEQKSGVNSLDALTRIGVDPNAYTTNDHTAYLFSCIDNFYEGLDEFMDYVQNPYFTDENVEKEKGIIGQEITMYADRPDWTLYLSALQAMYKNNPVRIDIAGTKESIAPITKEHLYLCYNTFYKPENMVMIVVGDFEPEEILEEIKKRLIPKEKIANLERIFKEEPEDVNEHEVINYMDISLPLFFFGFKDRVIRDGKKLVKKDVAINLIFNLLFGKSSNLFKKLYEQGIIFNEPRCDFEFAREYSHAYIQGQATDIEVVKEELIKEIENMKVEGLNKEHFERTKNAIYGSLVKQYNDVENIGNMFMFNYFKGINPFDYIEEYKDVTIEYAEMILKELFVKDKMVVSKVLPKK